LSCFYADYMFRIGSGHYQVAVIAHIVWNRMSEGQRKKKEIIIGETKNRNMDWRCMSECYLLQWCWLTCLVFCTKFRVLFRLCAFFLTRSVKKRDLVRNTILGLRKLRFIWSRPFHCGHLLCTRFRISRVSCWLTGQVCATHTVPSCNKIFRWYSVAVRETLTTQNALQWIHAGFLWQEKAFVISCSITQMTSDSVVRK
jgi:hypothetical protein